MGEGRPDSFSLTMLLELSTISEAELLSVNVSALMVQAINLATTDESLRGGEPRASSLGLIGWRAALEIAIEP